MFNLVFLQRTCHYPDNAAFYRDPERRLRQAFSCRHNMRAWEQCSDSSCRAVQQAFTHTQNCCMRVLGGCRECIEYRNILLFHASTCQLPFGKCVIEKCDDVRKYLSMEKKPLPDDKYWTIKHDHLFFRPSLPKTPTLLGSPTTREIHDDGTTAAFTESSSCVMLGAWNQYHVDRPPDGISGLSFRIDQLSDVAVTCSAFQQSDLPNARESHEDQIHSLPISQERLSDVPEPVGEIQISDQTVTFGPVNADEVAIHQHEDDEQSAAPLSAVHMPDASQGTKDTAPRQEILRSINRVMKCCVTYLIYIYSLKCSFISTFNFITLVKMFAGSSKIFKDFQRSAEVL